MIKSLKSGFTLAEVLTTLMVIGVVAAMTIPTLMNSTENQQAKVAAKKAASVLSQGIQLLVAQETECGNGANNWTNGTLAACMNNVMQGTISGTDSNILTTPDGMTYTFFANTSAKGSLAEVCGSSYLGAGNTAWRGGSNCAVLVDTNGFSKGSKESNPTYTAGSGFGSNPEQGKDNAAFSLTATGVRPMAFDGEGNAYEYVYGSKPSKELDTTTAWCKTADKKTCASTKKEANKNYCSSSLVYATTNPDAKTYETAANFTDENCGGDK